MFDVSSNLLSLAKIELRLAEILTISSGGIHTR